MAEYVLFKEKTHKFVTETTFNHVGDIESPTAPMFGRAKVIKNKRDIYYSPINPNRILKSYSNFEVVAEASKTSTSYTNAVNEYVACGDCLASCVVGEKKYMGLYNALYSLYVDYVLGSKGASIGISNSIILPSCNIKLIKYSSLANSILTETYSFTKTQLDPVGASSTSGNFTNPFQLCYICVPKTEDDVILGIEIEYPKYDITISNTASGLQYSLDDGVTFADVTEGLLLSQIEHVIFKNTSGNTVNIGTTASGTEVGTIASGATFVAVPEAGGTWYIS